MRNPADYDLVVVATPIWNASLSSPVRAYLARYGGSIRQVAHALTCGGFAIDRVFAQMAEASGRQPVARLAVREREFATPEMTRRIDRFAAQVRGALPREHVPAVAS